MLPSFDDFLYDMGQERISHWVDAANNAEIKMAVPMTPDATQQLATSIVTASQLITLEMMRDYHEWLQEQLKRKSVRLV